MTKLYGDFDRQDWLRVKGLEHNEVPQTLILHGEDGSIMENLADWETRLAPITHRPRWNMIVGSHQGVTVGFANVCWAPMAAIIAHQFCIMGTELVIQTGYFGGLDPTFRYGDILIVSEATGEDGVSSQYGDGKATHSATEETVQASLEICRQLEFPSRTGSVITTSTMLLETEEVIQQWATEGHVGVDGETAAVFAVAARFKRKAVALLNCSDLIISGDTIYDAPSDRRAVEAATDERIVTVALELAQIAHQSASVNTP